MNSICILLLALICLALVSSARNVTYDYRAIKIDGKRKLLNVGHVHYPRATPDQWRQIFRLSKEAGINTIDTYVFWNEHEQVRGEWDFSGNKDLRKFMRIAQEEGLYVVLRIGPYVCAEWNYGGFPAWLREIPGIDFRTNNEPFKQEMARFVEYMVDYTRDMFYTNGGNIILLQIENEYGLMEHYYGQQGHKYIEWASTFAQSLNTSETPWFMCQQNNVPSLINTCNGYYCDNWVTFEKPYRNQPGMFTELWTGWFMAWGDIRPTRPAADLAFSVLRWIARGGTYVAHYMWFGGTNFGRTAGYRMTTDYDYDAPIDQYGFKNEPKYSHMSKMQNILLDHEDVITGAFKWMPVGAHVEAHIYGDFKKSADSIVFLANTAHDNQIKRVRFQGKSYSLPPWSVSIIKGPAKNPTVLFNSAEVDIEADEWSYKSLGISSDQMTIESKREPSGLWNAKGARYSVVPLEQISATGDNTDYLWYVLPNVFVNKDHGTVSTLHFDNVEDIVYVYWNEKLVGAARGGKDIKIKIPVKPDSMNKLEVLTQTMGLTNFGPHVQNWVRGITGKIKFNDLDLTNAGWFHQTGLQGERLKYYNGDFEPDSSVALSAPLTWYKVSLPTLPKKYNKDGNAFVLDLAKMGKGVAWVNGNAIGRYWNITASTPDKPTNPYPQPAKFKPAPLSDQVTIMGEDEEYCDYKGSYNPDKCRSPKLIGKPTQRYYNVPRSWLHFDGKENVIVFFEEIGGKPYEIDLMQVTRAPVSESRKHIINQQ